jgi:hypothetical protein
MNKVRQLLSDATAAFGRLSSRERAMVGIIVAALLGFVFFVGSITYSRAAARREGRIKSKSEQMAEVQKLTGGYRQAEQQRSELERRLRGNNVKLFSYVDELARKQGVEIGGMTDKGSQPREGKIVESAVEVTFTRIGLDKLSNFLSAIETTGGLVKVTRLQVRPRTDAPVLDAWLTISTYQLNS